MRRWINPLDGSRLDTGLARGERSVETFGRLADDVGATPPARRRRLAPFPRASAPLRRGTNKRSGLGATNVVHGRTIRARRGRGEPFSKMWPREDPSSCSLSLSLSLSLCVSLCLCVFRDVRRGCISQRDCSRLPLFEEKNC